MLSVNISVCFPNYKQMLKEKKHTVKLVVTLRKLLCQQIYTGLVKITLMLKCENF